MTCVHGGGDNLEESILTTIKKLLGLDESYEAFDTDIIVAINTALMALIQMGVGPKNGFRIEDDEATWSDFLGSDSNDLEAAKSYVFIKARLMFDPPSSSVVVEAYNKAAAECEWRLNVQRDPE